MREPLATVCNPRRLLSHSDARCMLRRCGTRALRLSQLLGLGALATLVSRVADPARGDREGRLGLGQARRIDHLGDALVAAALAPADGGAVIARGHTSLQAHTHRTLAGSTSAARTGSGCGRMHGS